MALGSTQPLTEMSTRNLSRGVNAAGANGWQPATFRCRLSRNLGASTSWTLRPVQVCTGTLHFNIILSTPRSRTGLRRWYGTKLPPHAGNMKFITQNEEWIRTRIIICAVLYVHLSVYHVMRKYADNKIRMQFTT
jgi:hypothetical protein